MTQPKLLLSICEPELKQKILGSASIRKFDLIQPESADSWIECLMDTGAELVIAQVDDFDDKDLQRLTDGKPRLLANTDVIFLSSGEPNPAIDQAMLRGVSYHLRSPINVAYIEEIASDLYEGLNEDSSKTESVVESDLDQFGLLVGSSTKMKRLYRVIKKAADSDASIFVIGESGSGKELVANTMHMMSERREGPFVSINCGAISPELIESELFGHVKGSFTGATSDRIGVFEQAHGGTLFLDEVTEMSVDHQVKLLRVLESGEFRKVGSDRTQISDARIISATNREPADAIDAERFREDLYYRLAQFPISVPPLRDREHDIAGLAKHFLAHRNAEEGCSKQIGLDAIKKIESHNWPGNVRELMHTMERAFILADEIIGVDHLIIDSVEGEQSQSDIRTDMPLDEIEKSVILKTLEEKGGNKTETAEQLGISVKTLYNKLEKYASEE